jgi:hypothetical protein
LQSVKNIYNKFEYQESVQYLKSSGIDTDKIYFNRYNHFGLFCYYDDMVLVDIPVFTVKALKAFHTVELINLEKQRIEECLKKRDFKHLFYLIDKRIAFKSFLRLQEDMSPQERYTMFWFIYSRCGYTLDLFPRCYIDKIKENNRNPLNIPGIDKDGYIEIYRGQRTGSKLENVYSWSLDINIAIMFACQNDSPGVVYRAKLHKDKVVSYLKRKNEKEIIAYPMDLEDIKRVELPTINELLPELEAMGVISQYNKWVKRIPVELLYRPKGIHGISHVKRVLMLGLIMGYKLQLTQRQIEIICTAAIYHDIGRTNDNFDPHHGVKSINKLNHHNIRISSDPTDAEIIRYIIENHCVHDSVGLRNVSHYAIPDPGEAQYLLKMFKDADGLDRIRINDLDVKHLRNPEAHELLLIARQLLSNKSY